MAEVIIMPKLGFNMDEGQLVKWCKQVGESVHKGEVLFEINTDKTTMPVEATSDGVLLRIVHEEGSTVPVFTPIAVIGQAGEDADAALAAAGADGGQTPSAPAAATAPDAVSGASPEAYTPDPAAVKDLKLTPKARKLVMDEGIDPASLVQIKGTAFQGGISAKDIKASPLARKLAEQHGVDLASVQGSGSGGKIMKNDVQQAASGPAVGPAVGPASGPAAGPAAGSAPAGSNDMQILSVARYEGVRKIIGDRLAQSKFTAPHLYFTDSIDTTNLTAFRKEISETSGTKIAVTDLMILAVSKALQKHQQMNVTLKDGNIVCYKSVNVGFAVAGDNGLIVPVVKNTQEKTLSTIAKESRDLVERAKAGRLALHEFSGGTFSISNLGMFGIENFTAIINPPEAAILAISSVRKTPVVMTDENGEDSIAIRPMMRVQLTVDHRLIDGLLAAQFVGSLKDLLENPLKILL